MFQKLENRIGRVLLFLIPLLFAGCFGSKSKPEGGKAAAQGSPVVVSGTINKSFVPKEVKAVKIADAVGILLIEDDPFGVSIQFPLNRPPGTYPIGDRLNQPVVEIFAEYLPYEATRGLYLSMQGTLTLTESGGKYSGSFEFTAGNNRVHEKIIQIKGSFSEVSLPSS